MENVSLKNRKKIIIDYLNDVPPEKIASEIRISVDDVKNVLDEWKNGYISVFTNELEISDELKELAKMMKSKDISLEDLLQGYIYSQIFKDLDRDKTLKVIRELSGMNEDKRLEFVNTAEKMLKFSKYKNVNYVDIPDALESMVNRGKEINSELKEKEMLLRKLKGDIEIAEQNIKRLDEEERKLINEIEFSKNIKNYMREFKLDEKRIREFFELLSETGYSLEKWEEIYATIKALKTKNMDVENFMKLSNYLTELMNLGFTTSFLKGLEEELEKQSMNVGQFIDEIEDYIRNKIAYQKEIEELRKEHKALEKEIRSMRSEIKEYFKKIKPKMQ